MVTFTEEWLYVSTLPGGGLAFPFHLCLHLPGLRLACGMLLKSLPSLALDLFWLSVSRWTVPE